MMLIILLLLLTALALIAFAPSIGLTDCDGDAVRRERM